MNNENHIDYSTIKTEVKQITIGELQEMFRSGKIRLTDKSRSKRWNIEKKSAFIEMLMMGIPMPSVYLYYNPNTSCWTNMGVNKRLEILKAYLDEDFAISKQGAYIDSCSGQTYQTLAFQDRLSLNSQKITVNFISGISRKKDLQDMLIINSYHL